MQSNAKQRKAIHRKEITNDLKRLKSSFVMNTERIENYLNQL